ncbi:MAG: hypothetical protein M1820_004239 [Bogoriella megaspora]|nr:MAG: hypothetical protein M1820_004239 [Bogoriella megaspora]
MLSLREAIQSVDDAASAQDSGEEGAHGRLLQAIDSLYRVAATPTDMVARIRSQSMPLAITRIVIENGLLQAVSETTDKPITVAELAQKTGIDELLTLRLIRCIAGLGMVDEVGENTFAANDMTRYVVKPGPTAALRFQSDMFYPMFSSLVPYWQKHGTIHQFPEKPGEEYLFQHTFGDTIWGHLQSHPDWKRNFDTFMAYRAVTVPWYKRYPVTEELIGKNLKDDPQSVLLVDVAGGSGHDIRAFRENYPTIPGRCILEDLPETIQRVDAAALSGARAYFFRRILHDWSDNQCRNLLANTVAAMDEDYSRILIEDRILPSTGVPLSTALADINMMFNSGGVERTESQLHQLLDSVNLEITGVWKLAVDGDEGVVEARVIDRGLMVEVSRAYDKNKITDGRNRADSPFLIQN